jgi:hypothetical protein
MPPCRGVTQHLIDGLTDGQFRARPLALINPIAWLIWHSSRSEDVGVNRMAADRAQVLDDGWIDRLRIGYRHQGTGMTDNEVDELAEAQFSERDGFDATLRLLARQLRPDAIVACSLRLTTGAFAGIHRAGLRVPDDVAIVGYTRCRGRFCAIRR